MAASKISELTAIVAADTASGDLLTLVDVSAGTNMKITRDDLITATLNNATGLTSALLGTALASGDQVLVYDVSATAMVDMTRDELIAGLFNNATSVSVALAASATATDDLFLIHDTSAGLLKDITRAEIITMVADNVTAGTAALAGASTATDDLFLVYDTSATAMKDISRAELIAAIAANLTSQSIANAALQNALVATTSLKITSSGTACTKLLSATAALDFGSINAAASADLTITVTGAAVGDAVHLGLPAAPTAGIVFNAFVSAADTVTVRATNITAAPVDPVSATYRAVVSGF